MLRIEGLGTALVTPFRDGAVDYASYEALVRRQVAAGVDFLVPLGSTAETPCLEDDEKVRLLDMTRRLFSGPVVAGVGTNSLQATLRNIRLLEPYGADAWLVVVPYYNKPTQEGMYQYFKAVAESTDKAVILYNVPGRTGSNIKPETVLRLTRIPNIIAIKEASGDVNQILKIRREAPADFTVLSGNDDQTLPLVASGCNGVISVASNLAPVQMAALCAALRKGDMAEAVRLNNALMPLYDACFVESNPIPAKGALCALGLCANELRLPLTPATPPTVEKMHSVLAALGVTC
ncbi:MAG: 4-hydroxy-tetrahydrodipicolinate synthase [Bacteroidales bacterium]|nr:4-hydroxy-tetrahydrodipicolinate synthase [Bacteroidales bacterium]